MNELLSILKETAIFMLASQLILHFSVEKQYDHGELVCTYGTSSEQIGIVLEGTVQLLRTHLDGLRATMDLAALYLELA